MPFRNPGTVVAKVLKIIGTAGQQIISAADPPRLEFYSGLPAEVNPAFIRLEPIPGANEVAMLLLSSSEMNAVSGPASILLISREDGSRDALLNLETLLMDPGAGDAIIGSVANRLRIQNQGTASEIDMQNDGDIAYQAPAGALHRLFGGVRIEDGGLLFRNSGTDIGGIAFGIDMGRASDDCFGGNGSLLIPHNFGDTDFRAIGQPSSAGGARFLTRSVGNDTNANIGFQAWNDAGGNPANGTNVTVEWIGIKFA